MTSTRSPTQKKRRARYSCVGNFAKSQGKNTLRRIYLPNRSPRNRKRRFSARVRRSRMHGRSALERHLSRSDALRLGVCHLSESLCVRPLAAIGELLLLASEVEMGASNVSA